MYELEINRTFSAAHRLVGYAGDCCKLHGHNWQVTVVLTATALDAVGIAVDFKVLKGELERVLSRFDHAYLNDLEEFATMNPTSENLARRIYEALKPGLESATVRLSRVKVAESPGSVASYYE